MVKDSIKDLIAQVTVIAGTTTDARNSVTSGLASFGADVLVNTLPSEISHLLADRILVVLLALR